MISSRSSIFLGTRAMELRPSALIPPGRSVYLPITLVRRPSLSKVFCSSPPFSLASILATGKFQLRCRKPARRATWSQPSLRIFPGLGGTGTMVYPGKRAVISVARHWDRKDARLFRFFTLYALSRLRATPVYEYSGKAPSNPDALVRQRMHRTSSETIGLPQIMQRLPAWTLSSAAQAAHSGHLRWASTGRLQTTQRRGATHARAGLRNPVTLCIFMQHKRTGNQCRLRSVTADCMAARRFMASRGVMASRFMDLSSSRTISSEENNCPSSFLDNFGGT